MDGDHARTGALAVLGHRSLRQTAKQGTHRGSSLGKASGNCGDSTRSGLEAGEGAGGEGWERSAEDPEGTLPSSLAPASLSLPVP